jgi:hypothetical protein
MTVGDDYRAKAAEFRALAENQTDPKQRAEFENLANFYVRLAQHADENVAAIIDVEIPPEDDDGAKH